MGGWGKADRVFVVSFDEGLTSRLCFEGRERRGDSASDPRVKVLVLGLGQNPRLGARGGSYRRIRVRYVREGT